TARGRTHTVEVDRTSRDGGEEVIRFGDAQQVPWPVVRQLLGDPLHDGSEVLLLQGPSDPEATEAALALCLGLLRKLHQSAGSLAAQVLVLRPLHHAPQDRKSVV